MLAAPCACILFNMLMCVWMLSNCVHHPAEKDVEHSQEH
jgi:hypothetical protein